MTAPTSWNRSSIQETYSITNSGAVKRLRTPHPHDVLSGRGGGINGHVGNKTFREWVRERKEAYNLAESKAEKAHVANEVIDLVRSRDPPGRFLQRDPSSTSGPSWWVELDEAKVLAKTSQALREGAPQIRAAHKVGSEERAIRTKGPKREKPPSTVDPTAAAPSTLSKFPAVPALSAPLHANYKRSISTEKALECLQENLQKAKSLSENERSQIVAPLLSNMRFDEKNGRPNKRARPGESTSCLNKPFDPLAETPPLTSSSDPLANEIPPLNLSIPSDATNSNKVLFRSNSLALSDFSNGKDGYEDFVNPFADESDILNRVELYADENCNKFSEKNESFTELSGLQDTPYLGANDTDFGEGMKSIFDAVHPDLTSPDKGDWSPTLLMPWRGGKIKRRTSNASLRNFTKSGRQ